ncbi:MAG TPA: selenoneine synthase SenA [Anaeromyxobacter sp.]|nr:selenoneine synthase SenA [Anaeromyxobacter sp.]
MPRADALLTTWVSDARRRTLELVRSLREGELLGPMLAIVNPPLWELGHVAWFEERWALRHAAGRDPLRADVDAHYDSSAIPHDTRWSLPLPTLADTEAYLRATSAAVQELLPRLPERDRYFVELAVLHEDMHGEAMAFSRQTLGWAAPSGLGEMGRAEGQPDEAAPERAGGLGGRRLSAPPQYDVGGDLTGDAHVPGGALRLGSTPDEPWVFDNEKWAHEVVLEPFSIARAPVTQARYAAFVEEDGYRRRELWSDAGWAWREAQGAEAPAYWRRDGRTWLRRDFDRWVPLEPHRPVVNVCLHEAEAYCRFARRRLPTEAEWEAAAAGEPGPGGKLAPRKRRWPWGDDPPGPGRAHLDFRALGAVDVGAFAAGDSAFGCRQMIGNVWEWTASPFLPFPGFSADPYRDYSQPWFGTHQVVRGGSFATTGRLVRNAFRNFYEPHRRDPWIGFRTCAP